jgi:tRNA (guanine37-N1)-methyltransferase
MNLRDDYLPYRFLIGQVILEKNSGSIRTVVNKLDNIDAEFRFFEMELLAGAPEFDVTVSESDCSFQFDFRQVYWNSRLHTEHDRLVRRFQPYEVVADVMAGVGPFAMPAAKKKCYVLANDLNPASFKSLEVNTKRNKVEKFCIASCEDGREFIRNAIRRTWKQGFEGKVISGEGDSSLSNRERRREERRQKIAAGEARKQDPSSSIPPAPFARGRKRRLIDHFVMNLPGSALEFLDAYRGAYRLCIDDKDALEEELRYRRENTSENGREWPMVHVHCFTKMVEQPYEDIIAVSEVAFVQAEVVILMIP